jgi:hypothetical protein
MDGGKKLTSEEIIENWNRTKYPSFQDYMNSAEYAKLVGNDEV